MTRNRVPHLPLPRIAITYTVCVCYMGERRGGAVVREIRLSYKNDRQRKIKLNPLQHWGCCLACKKKKKKTKQNKNKSKLVAFISFSRELLPPHLSNNPSLCGNSCNNHCLSSFGLKFGTSVALQFEQGPGWAPRTGKPSGRCLPACLKPWSE